MRALAIIRERLEHAGSIFRAITTPTPEYPEEVQWAMNAAARAAGVNVARKMLEDQANLERAQSYEARRHLRHAGNFIGLNAPEPSISRVIAEQDEQESASRVEMSLEDTMAALGAAVQREVTPAANIHPIADKQRARG